MVGGWLCLHADSEQLIPNSRITSIVCLYQVMRVWACHFTYQFDCTPNLASLRTSTWLFLNLVRHLWPYLTQYERLQVAKGDTTATDMIVFLYVKHVEKWLTFQDPCCHKHSVFRHCMIYKLSAEHDQRHSNSIQREIWCANSGIISGIKSTVWSENGVRAIPLVFDHRFTSWKPWESQNKTQQLKAAGWKKRSGWKEISGREEERWCSGFLF